ncbi:MAG: zinc-ribbon domain-containing protein [Clostridia bacterium]|nr:zinc-ribbon domain-containing protein [Clostridia bacterium]
MIKYHRGKIMFCNNCGEDNRDDRDFCIRCGKPLKEGIQKTPKQIKKEEKEKYDHILCNSRTYQIINIILWSLVSVSAILTLISYYLKGNAKFAIIVIAFILLLGCFGLIITKRTMRKRTKEAFKLAEKDTLVATSPEKQEFEQIKLEDISQSADTKENQTNEEKLNKKDN